MSLPDLFISIHVDNYLFSLMYLFCLFCSYGKIHHNVDYSQLNLLYHLLVQFGIKMEIDSINSFPQATVHLSVISHSEATSI